MPQTVMDEAQCKQEHELWREEIAAWKEDHARALRTLENVTSFILKHEAQLDEHMKEVEKHEAMDAVSTDEIRAIRERHLGVKNQHNALRGRHRGLIMEILRLQVTLHKAEHGQIFAE